LNGTLVPHVLKGEIEEEKTQSDYFFRTKVSIEAKKPEEIKK